MDQKLITNKDEKNLLPSTPINTITDVIVNSGKLKTLVSIKKENPEVISDYIELMLTEITEHYGESWSSLQKFTFIEAIIKLGYYSNIADLKLFKEKCIKGDYDLKFRLVPSVLVSWFKEYLSDRADKFEEYNIKRKPETRGASDIEIAKDKNVDRILKLVELFKKEDTYVSEDKRPRTEYEVKISQLANIFFEEFITANKANDAARKVITYKGKEMVSDDYFLLRFKEIKEPFIKDFNSCESIPKDKIDYISKNVQRVEAISGRKIVLHNDVQMNLEEYITERFKSLDINEYLKTKFES